MNKKKITITKLPQTDKKKYKIVIETDDRKKTLKIGQQGASDYTINKNKQTRERYIQRHKENEDWNDPYTAGFWSRWLTWGPKDNINEAKKYSINKAKKLL